MAHPVLLVQSTVLWLANGHMCVCVTLEHMHMNIVCVYAQRLPFLLSSTMEQLIGSVRTNARWAKKENDFLQRTYAKWAFVRTNGFWGMFMCSMYECKLWSAAIHAEKGA